MCIFNAARLSLHKHCAERGGKVRVFSREMSRPRGHTRPFDRKFDDFMAARLRVTDLALFVVRHCIDFLWFCIFYCIDDNVAIKSIDELFKSLKFHEIKRDIFFIVNILLMAFIVFILNISVSFYSNIYLAIKLENVSHIKIHKIK